MRTCSPAFHFISTCWSLSHLDQVVDGRGSVVRFFAFVSTLLLARVCACVGSGTFVPLKQEGAVHLMTLGAYWRLESSGGRDSMMMWWPPPANNNNNNNNMF